MNHIYTNGSNCLCYNLSRSKRYKFATNMEVMQWSGFQYCKWTKKSSISQAKHCGFPGFSRSIISWKEIPSESPQIKLNKVPKKGGIRVLSRNIASPGLTFEQLRAWDDAYDGVIIDPDSLPSSANAFASALKASLSNWKSKGKKGIWLKILLEQAELVPIAIQEGFDYHHAESGYVMLTHWIPSEPCILPASPSHQVGVAGFVINDQKEILVVKEKCSCSCLGVWKLPTGYINKSEDIFSGAVREVKEETGVDTAFLEMVAFRHAHLLAFEKSDLMFVCMLKPLSFEITVDEKEIQAAKWMPLDEVLGQPFYREDHMSRSIIEVCKAAHEGNYSGFIGYQLTSKFDGNTSSCLYYNNNIRTSF